MGSWREGIKALGLVNLLLKHRQTNTHNHQMGMITKREKGVEENGKCRN